MMNKICFFVLALLLPLLSSCKKECPDNHLLGGPSFGFYLFHADTGLPLITNDSTSPYPIHSVKLVDEWGNGWTNTNNFNDPKGPSWSGSVYPEQAQKIDNDTSRFYLHFLTTGDIDTIKVLSKIYKQECGVTYSSRYFYNGAEVPVDSTNRGWTHAPIDWLSIRKRP